MVNAAFSFPEEAKVQENCTLIFLCEVFHLQGSKQQQKKKHYIVRG